MRRRESRKFESVAGWFQSSSGPVAERTGRNAYAVSPAAPAVAATPTRRAMPSPRARHSTVAATSSANGVLEPVAAAIAGKRTNTRPAHRPSSSAAAGRDASASHINPGAHNRRSRRSHSSSPDRKQKPGHRRSRGSSLTRSAATNNPTAPSTQNEYISDTDETVQNTALKDSQAAAASAAKSPRRRRISKNRSAAAAAPARAERRLRR